MVLVLFGLFCCLGFFVTNFYPNQDSYFFFKTAEWNSKISKRKYIFLINPSFRLLC